MMVAEEAVVKDPADMTLGQIERELTLLQRKDDPADQARVISLMQRLGRKHGTRSQAVDPRRAHPI